MSIIRQVKLFGPALGSDAILQLKVLLIENKISNEELAKRSGYKVKYIKKLLKGSAQITMKELVTFSLVAGGTCSISIHKVE